MPSAPRAAWRTSLCLALPRTRSRPRPRSVAAPGFALRAVVARRYRFTPAFALCVLPLPLCAPLLRRARVERWLPTPSAPRPRRPAQPAPLRAASRFAPPRALLRLSRRRRRARSLHSACVLLTDRPRPARGCALAVVVAVEVKKWVCALLAHSSCRTFALSARSAARASLGRGSRQCFRRLPVAGAYQRCYLLWSCTCSCS
jgi:hypothetical protein